MIQKKMMFAALAAILLGVCIACNAPQQDKQRKDLTKTKKSMTNKELKEKLTLALEDMKAKAIEMGIHGVAVASVLNNGDSADWMGEMKVVGTPLDLEGGYNLVAVAWSKCAEVIATMADSGNPDALDRGRQRLHHTGTLPLWLPMAHHGPLVCTSLCRHHHRLRLFQELNVEEIRTIAKEDNWNNKYHTTN